MAYQDEFQKEIPPKFESKLIQDKFDSERKAISSNATPIPITPWRPQDNQYQSKAVSNFLSETHTHTQNSRATSPIPSQTPIRASVNIIGN